MAFLFAYSFSEERRNHYSDVIISTMASQITSPTIIYTTVYSGADQRKNQSTASLAFMRGIHRWPVNSPHKGQVTRKMFPFDDVIMMHGKWDKSLHDDVMMWPGNAFRITGPLWGESTDHRQICLKNSQWPRAIDGRKLLSKQCLAGGWRRRDVDVTSL